MANSQTKHCLVCASNTPCTTALLLASSYTPCKLASSLPGCAWTALRQLADSDDHLTHCQFPYFCPVFAGLARQKGYPMVRGACLWQTTGMQRWCRPSLRPSTGGMACTLMLAALWPFTTCPIRVWSPPASLVD